MNARCRHGLRADRCAVCTTAAVLVELATTVDQLAANLLPGTARPWRAPQISAERRAELDRQDREDRLHIAQQGDLPAHLRGQGVVVPPGESDAPYDLDIADLLSDILVAGDLLADQAAGVVEAELRTWAGAWADQVPSMAPPPAQSAFADPSTHWSFVAALLEDVARLNPDLLEHIADTAAMHVRRAAPALGLITDGQLLAALCPWCDGKTSAAPVGGHRTLRVRTLPGGLPAVVCEGGSCDPPEAECGARWRGLPAWPEHEWTWLAARLHRAEGAA